MKPAHHAQIATRLDLLEQKAAAGGDAELKALVERIFDTVLGWSYTGPNEGDAISEPPSANQTVYDTMSPYGYSMQLALFGKSEAGGASVPITWLCENLDSFWSTVWTGGVSEIEQMRAEGHPTLIQRVNAVKFDGENLRVDHDALRGDHDALQQEVSDLHSSLMSEINSLKARVSALEAQSN